MYEVKTYIHNVKIRLDLAISIIKSSYVTFFFIMEDQREFKPCGRPIYVFPDLIIYYTKISPCFCHFSQTLLSSRRHQKLQQLMIDT